MAAKAGVSRTTVSYVLNGGTSHSISAETRERVLQAARDLHYRSNRLANGVLRGKSQIIGVIVPQMENVFIGRIVQGIQDCCSSNEYHVLLANNLQNPTVEGKQVHLMLEHRVEGVMFVTDESTVQHIPEWLPEIQNSGVACVIIDDRTYSATTQCVVTDDVDGAKEVVEHLLRLGHTRIGHVAGGQTASSARDRLHGYEQALLGAGIELRSHFSVGFSYTSADIHDGVTLLMQSEERPTALFVANDHMVPRVLDILGGLGLSVPGDVAIVGFGDVELAPCLQLTTVHQDYYEMGRAAAQRMFDILSGSNVSNEQITVPTHTVIRGSCGTPVVGWPRYTSTPQNIR